MLRRTPKKPPGRVMVLWQFITFVVLIAALLVYTSVITLRLGRADARLKRIEEALLFLSRSSESADSGVAEVTPPPEVSDEKEVRGGYLTLRDLRVRSEQMSSRTTRPDIRNPAAELEKSAVIQTADGLAQPPPVRQVSSESTTSGMESGDAPATTSEPPSLPIMEAISEEPAATSQERHDEPAAGSEPSSLPDAEAMNAENNEAPPDQPPSPDDSVAKKNQQTLLFLSSQRRRRRERLGH